MEIKRLTEEDFERVAQRLGVEVAVIKAVQLVETGGRGGFIAPGRPRILFEGHIFWRRLKALGFRPEDYVAGYEDILYPKWTKEYYKGGEKEYERLERALALAEKIGRTPEECRAIQGAAYESISSGMFQVMGFNYPICGYEDVWKFWEAMQESEGSQLDAFAGFVLRNKLAEALKMKDWARFAKGYNGPGYAQNNYHVKLAEAYAKAGGK